MHSSFNTVWVTLHAFKFQNSFILTFTLYRKIKQNIFEFSTFAIWSTFMSSKDGYRDILLGNFFTIVKNLQSFFHKLLQFYFAAKLWYFEISRELFYF